MANRDQNPQLTSKAEPPPGAWRPAHHFVKRARQPVERFLAIEASSGIVLLLAAVIALWWANSSYRESYLSLWHTTVGLRLGALSFERSLHFWINDGLMTIFFFVVGLEIRREIHCGELSELRRAALPLAAALGGMLLPAGIYFAINSGRASESGWGVPMATDIAFAVGTLALLGARVPPAMRILLLALAVIDDVGSILVIALFYSGGIELLGLAAVGLGVLGVFALQLFGVRNPWLYVAPALVVWAGAYGAGVHPTLAGVVVGMMTPARAWFARHHVADHAEARVPELREADNPHEALAVINDLGQAQREAVSPVERLQHALHGYVAFLIMPLFALANAGVPLGQAALSGDSLFVFVGVVLGLGLGKPLGILGISLLAVKAGWVAIPRGLHFGHVALVGLVGGIGFTMAIFVAQLAFPEGPLLETAKLGILVASGGAALLSFALGRMLLPSSVQEIGALTEAEAEGSTAH